MREVDGRPGVEQLAELAAQRGRYDALAPALLDLHHARKPAGLVLPAESADLLLCKLERFREIAQVNLGVLAQLDEDRVAHRLVADIVGPNQHPAHEHQASIPLRENAAVCREVAIRRRLGRLRNAQCHLRHARVTARMQKKFTRAMEPPTARKCRKSGPSLCPAMNSGARPLPSRSP